MCDILRLALCSKYSGGFVVNSGLKQTWIHNASGRERKREYKNFGPSLDPITCYKSRTPVKVWRGVQVAGHAEPIPLSGNHPPVDKQCHSTTLSIVHVK